MYKKSGQLTTADRCALIFKVTQGHWLIQSKAYTHNFLLVINWDLRSISHRLQDMVPRSWKPPNPILRPPDQGTPLNIVIKLNRQITVVQCYCIVKTAWFQLEPFGRNTHKTDDRAVNWRSRSFKVTDLCCNRKPIYDFLLVINCHLCSIRTVSEI